MIIVLEHFFGLGHRKDAKAMDISREGGGSIQFHSFWIFDSPNQMRIHGKHRANFTNKYSDRRKYSSLRFKNKWCFFYGEAVISERVLGKEERNKNKYSFKI